MLTAHLFLYIDYIHNRRLPALSTMVLRRKNMTAVLLAAMLFTFVCVR